MAAFVFGICLSLVANIGSAPMLSVLQVTVAACPPLVLLLAVELLNGALKRRTDTESARAEQQQDESSLDGDRSIETSDVVRLRSVPASGSGSNQCTAEQRMWAYYISRTAAGHTPSGAELDRIAGTDNYGRRILRQWRAANKIPRQPQLTTAATAD
ncbi:hypothetical protein AB0878_36585 [Amycolatopsis sp. NPDC047767]|uniref:hypothetical protein n=1 Tax=Amycolatopsis sp. NPDC047767 TaxID=3156765 RepID=UPI0034515524